MAWRSVVRWAWVTMSMVALAGCGGTDLAAPLAVDDATGQSQADLALERGRFELFEGLDGQFYFHLLAGNGQKVLASEGYRTWSNAEEGIGAVQRAGVESSRYEVRPAADGQWYFVLVAANDEVVGVSETYPTRANAQRAVGTVTRVVKATVERGAAISGPAHFRLFRGVDGQHYFHLRATNGEILLQSEGYTDRGGAENGITSVREHGADASRYELHTGEDGRTYFVLRAVNGEIIGRGQSYAEARNAEAGIDACIRLVAEAPRATD